MTRIPPDAVFNLLRRLRARIRYRDFDRDLAEEIEFHRAMKQAEIEASGVSASDARAASLRALGNVTYMREEARAVWMARWLEHAWQDLRYAVRGLRREPGVSAMAVLILGISTGLLTTVVIFADASMLQPWRVPEPDRIRRIRPSRPSVDGFGPMRIPEYLALRRELDSWTSLSLALRGADEDLTFDNGATERVDALYVSAEYFETLGLRLPLGQPFTADRDQFDTPPDVVVISHRLWRRHLASDQSAIGRQVRLGSRTFTIVGITPEGFLDGHGSHREVWIPLTAWLDRASPEARRAFLGPRHQSVPIDVLGRLAPGVSDEQATAELNARSKAFRSEAGLEAPGYRAVDTRPISASGSRDLTQLVAMVASALLLVQVLACANVGNLLLARALSRRWEVAVRLALGAGRSRVLRQLLTEAALLIALATAMGWAIASAVPWIVIPRLPEWDQRPEFYEAGLPTFLTLAGLGALSILMAGLAPAMRASRTSLFALASRRHGHPREGIRLQRTLLAVQIALSAILLSGAGLLTRAVGHALASEPGFRMDEFQEVSFEFSTPFDRDRRIAFHRQLFALTQTPDWPPIAFSDYRPVDDAPVMLTVRVPEASGMRLESMLLRPVSANYFDVLGVRLLAGRMPAPGAAVPEMVLNRLAAERLWPGENPLGRTITSGFRSDTLTTQVVVGIVPDLAGRTIVDRRPIAYRTSNFVRAYVVVRTGDPAVVTRLADLARQLEPDVVTVSRPLAESAAETMLPARIGGQVAWAIGALALVLATVGAFGVFAYAVEARRREVGIRMALGARAPEVVRHVLRSTQLPMLAGVGAGIAMAAAAAPLLGAYLYGLSPFDPVSYLQVVAILASASALATWIPARRATRVNPAGVLRAD